MAVASQSKSRSNDFYAALKARRAELEAAFRKATPKSAALHEQAKSHIPGGYGRDSIVRKPYAAYMTKGSGAEIEDVDGRRLVDFWFNATSLPLGHADPRVVAAVSARVRDGSAFYAPTESEIELAQMISERLSSGQRVRFTNSGSEAVMLAIRIARAFTGRELMVKCEGSYHGTYDDMAWSVGPPANSVTEQGRPTPVPESAGLLSSLGRTLVIPFNDVPALERAFQENAGKIAAFILEPLANRIGLVLPSREFVQAALKACDKSGTVLIFDEVIAFRLGYHGAQGHHGVTPHLTTLGKVIGGGFPVGAIAGRADIMAMTDIGRANRVSHAGTFNANPVTVAAGRATLTALTPAEFDRINGIGAKVRSRLEAICAGLPLQVTGAASTFKVNATERPIVDYQGAASVDKDWEDTAAMALFNRGLMVTPQLHGCISTATTEAQVDRLLDAFADVVKM
ncbi:MAG: aspartate aminotransferase family protein [Rhodospirillales bacterium]|nr:aspartate aminotransferase family protein [Rhodospirillales bacterium]